MSAVLVDKFAPVKRADGYALSEERLDWQLENWAALDRAKWDAEHGFEVSRGYSMSVDFDEMCADMDRRCAEATGAVIAGLTPVERAAVMNKLLAVVFRFPREEMQNAWIRARWSLARSLYLRGIV